MNKNTTLLLAALTFFTFSHVQAEESSINYSFFDVRGILADYNGESGSGFMLDASHDIGNNLRVSAAYIYGAADDVDYWQEDLYVSLGYIMGINQSTHAVFDAGYLTEWIENAFTDDSDSGLRLSAKVRHNIDNKIEIYASASSTDIWDDTSSGISIGAIFTPSEKISWGAEYESIEDTDLIQLFARFYR